MKLSDIAEVRTGLVLSRKQATDFENVNYTYRLLTLSSVDAAGWLSEQNLDTFFSKEYIDEEYFTRVGDVVMRLSSPNTSVVIDKRFAGLLIPSQFAIIRGEQRQILSGYLNVVLNGKKAQAELAKIRNGTVIQTVSTVSIKELEINEMSFDRQEKIIQLTDLLHRKAWIQKRIAYLEKLFFDNAINKMLIGESK